ncbi:MAG: hypothetical protein IPI48_18540 [bacterium]|nr:hypothetical protein [bacterium]
MVDDLSERTGSPRRAMSVQEIVERMPGDDGGVADAGNPDDDRHPRFERRQAPCVILYENPGKTAKMRASPMADS